MEPQAKPSRLRPPSKIVRPCTVDPKPALPAAATPSVNRLNGSLSGLRKISEEAPKKRLTDIYEGSTDDMESVERHNGGDRRNSSVSTSSSTADYALWDNIRRLSEAGVRRSSDASIVLTEDTDSFIIGDRIWVGGTKPGQIAYIGETQFAPGDWAGVVLDEPVGKNDGQVAGVRYFQCEPRRGVFSRLTRLTRAPLQEADEESVTGGPGNGMKTSNGGPGSGLMSPRGSHTPLLSPAGSVKELVLKKPPTTLSHNQAPPAANMGELKVGERVIVMSSMGSKAGVLRFIGVTEFASGEWCGVELDDPIGKNDGSVDGKRYFQCEPKYGLFAPLHKVSRSPSSRRTSSCVVHKGASGATPMKRAGSRESMTSITSAASSTNRSARRSNMRMPTTPATPKSSLQDVLREKTAQVEHLSKEIALNRTELTRAATQADVAEQQLAAFKNEFEEYQNVTQAKLNNIEMALLAAQKQNSELTNNLEDEKRKVEDLQFRFEEESIVKSDLEATCSSRLTQIEELEKNLSQITEQFVVLQADASRLQQVEEALAVSKEEAENLKLKLAELSTSSESESVRLLEEHKQEMESLKSELAETRTAGEEEARKLWEEHRMEVEQLQQHLTEARKLEEEEMQKLHEKHKDDVEKLQKELMEALNFAEVEKNRLLEEHRLEMESLLKEKDDAADEMRSQLEKAIGEAQCLRLDLEDSKKLLKSKNDEANSTTSQNLAEIASLNKKIDDTSFSMKQQVEQLQKEISSLKETENNLKQDLEDTQSTLKDKAEEVMKKDTLLKDQGKVCDTLRRSIDELNQALKVKSEDYEKQVSLVNDLNSELKNKSEVSAASIHTSEEKLLETTAEYETKLKEKLSLVQDLEKKLQEAELSSNLLENNLHSTKEEFDTNVRQLIESHNKTLEEKKSVISDLECKILDRDDELRKLKGNISDQDSKMFQKEEQIKVQLEELEELKRKISSLEEYGKEHLKEVQKYQLEVGDLQRKLNAADEKSNELVQQKQKLEDRISEVMGSSSDSSIQLSTLNDELRLKNEELEVIKAAVISSNQESEMMKQKLEQATEQLNRTEQELQVKLDITVQQAQVSEQNNLKKLEESKELEKKMKQELETVITEMKKNEMALKQNLEKVQEEALQSQRKLSDMSKEATLLKEKLSKQIEEVMKDKSSIEEHLSNECKKLLTDCEQKQIELNKNTVRIAELEKKLIEKQLTADEEKKQLIESLKLNHSQEIEKLTHQKKESDDNLMGKNEELAVFKDKVLKLEEEKSNLQIQLSKIEKKSSSLEEELKCISQASSEASSSIKLREEQFSKTSEEFANAQAQMQLVQNDLQSKCSEVLDLTKSLEDSKTQAEAAEKALQEIKVKFSNANQELVKLAEDKNLTENSLCKKDSQVISLSQELDKVREETELREKIIAENAVKFTTLSEELTGARESKAAIELLLSEKETKLLQSTEEIEKLLTSIKVKETEYNTSLAELQSARASEQLQIQTLQQTLQQLQSQKEEWTQKSDSLLQASENSDILARQVESLQKDLETAKLREKDINATIEAHVASSLEKLNQAEKERVHQSELVAKQSEVIDTLTSQVVLLQEEVKEARLREQDIITKKEAEMFEFERILEQNKITLEQKEKELFSQKAEKSQLLEENAKATKYKIMLENLDKEKKQLEKKVSTLEIITSQTKINANSSDPLHLKLIEEQELAQSQIDFLNSVIVEMQKKNETLKARVEILEMGVLPSDADELNLNGITPKTLPPRLYCDICEVFDLHDTEDCPRQAMDSPPPASPKLKTKAKERPYCESCEVFGHDTADCDDGETF